MWKKVDKIEQNVKPENKLVINGLQFIRQGKLNIEQKKKKLNFVL